MDLCGDNSSVRVDNRVDILHAIKVGLVVGVLDALTPPRYVRQLGTGQHRTDTERERVLGFPELGAVN